MPIHNHPSLYTGGGERFNSRPSVQLYGQLMARKQARDDAYDEYIRNLNKSINSSGMRNVDRPVFDKQLERWQKMGMERRDDIRNRKNGADIEFMQGYQDLLNTVSESKTEEEKKKPAVEMLLDPAKRDRLNNDDFIKAIHKHDQPIYIMDEKGGLQRNPNRKSLDYGSVIFNPKPFEQDKYFKQFEDIKKMDLPPVVEKNPKDMTQMVTTTSIFDPEAKEIVRTRATTDYFQNPSFRDVIDKLNPADYNEDFKNNYGHDIENKGDLAAAYTLKGLQTKAVKSEYKEDTFGQRKELARLNHLYRLGEKDFEHELSRTDKETADIWIKDNVESKIAEAKKTTPVVYTDAEGNKKLGHNIPMDTYWRKQFSVTVDGKVLEPDGIRLTDKDEIQPVFIKYDDKGKPKRNDDGSFQYLKTIGIPHTVNDAIIALGGGAGVKQKNIEGAAMYGKGGGKESTINKKTSYKYKNEPITQEQVEKAAQQSGMTVEEYIKAFDIK